MISKPLLSLLERAGRIRQTSSNAFLGVLIAFSTPILALLVGGILSCMIGARQQEIPSDPARFARVFPNPATMLPADMTPLSKVTVLLFVAVFVVVVTAILLMFFYRQVQSAAVAFEVAMIERLRHHAKSLARVRTLSAQQQALTDGLDYHLPRVRASLSRWWRTVPRHVVQLVACVLVAVLIEPMLAILALIATGLILLVYRYLDRSRRTSLPVVRERAAQERGELVNLSLKGPLLESVHEEHEVERRFADQLAHYRKDAIGSLTSSSWKTPTIVLIGGVLLCLFLFVIAVQIIGSESSFGLAGAFTFTLCCVGAAVSLVRLQRALRELRTVESAAEELDRFMAIPVEEFDNEELKQIDRVTEHAELDHVTVQDSRGRKLLENVSVVFNPGRLIGVVASQPLQANALVELLMGFGRPVSGRMLVDGQVVTDLRPDSLAHCSHWVASDGALVTGTVKDNLVGTVKPNGAVDIRDTIKLARLTEIVQQLPDGLSTIISPGDDRLTADAPFRLGVARAAIRAASIVVIEEPRSSNYDQEAEQQTLEAIRALVSDTIITVILPQRLATLRQCDMVVMVHDHKVADIGSHSELLQRNELYRHLTYLRFNAFRNS